MNQLPEELKTLRISSNDPYGPLSYAIKNQLRINNIKLIDENLENMPILKILSSSEKSETVSIYQDGKSAEKQLIFFVNAKIILPNGIFYSIKTDVKRIFFDNPLETLAKDAENELVKQEMREQAAHQLIYKLLIIYNTIQNQSEKLIIKKKSIPVDSE
ncbi:MAG: LPS assembly lipoprotein LptE [Arsenophonus sp. ET-YP4-MAG3]